MKLGEFLEKVTEAHEELGDDAEVIIPVNFGTWSVGSVHPDEDDKGRYLAIVSDGE